MHSSKGIKWASKLVYIVYDKIVVGFVHNCCRDVMHNLLVAFNSALLIIGRNLMMTLPSRAVHFYICVHSGRWSLYNSILIAKVSPARSNTVLTYIYARSRAKIDKAKDSWICILHAYTFIIGAPLFFLFWRAAWLHFYNPLILALLDWWRVAVHVEKLIPTCMIMLDLASTRA
jgi:hypothetical protein